MPERIDNGPPPPYVQGIVIRPIVFYIVKKWDPVLAEKPKFEPKKISFFIKF